MDVSVKSLEGCNAGLCLYHSRVSAALGSGRATARVEVRRVVTKTTRVMMDRCMLICRECTGVRGVSSCRLLEVELVR